MYNVSYLVGHHCLSPLQYSFLLFPRLHSFHIIQSRRPTVKSSYDINLHHCHFLHFLGYLLSLPHYNELSFLSLSPSTVSFRFPTLTVYWVVSTFITIISHHIASYHFLSYLVGSATGLALVLAPQEL